MHNETLDTFKHAEEADKYKYIIWSYPDTLPKYKTKRKEMMRDMGIDFPLQYCSRGSWQAAALAYP